MCRQLPAKPGVPWLVVPPGASPHHVTLVRRFARHRAPPRKHRRGATRGGPFTLLDYHRSPDVQREVVMKAPIPTQGGTRRADAQAESAGA